MPVRYGDRRMTNSARRHLSMLRSYTAADAFTIGNAACGTMAIFLCLDYIADDNRRFLWAAFLLLPLALVCDVLDGYVAPLGLRGAWDMLILTFFVVCGVSRLARFNVTAAALSDGATGKVKYFEGTPIPTSILIVMLLGVAAYLGRIDERLWLGVVRLGPAALHPLALVYGINGSAMISATLRVPKP
jgi:CDP-diacylglycerol--serine O-phosphatidyltransferase